MITFFPEYRAQVIEKYRQQKAANTLPPNLMRPTPGRLKAECLAVCKERFSKKDEHTLRAFFDPAPDANVYVRLIEKFKTEKFKPLLNFLKGETDEPDEKNVELLAWLIDFQPRPFDRNMRLDSVNSNISEPKIETAIINETCKTGALEHKAVDVSEQKLLLEEASALPAPDSKTNQKPAFIPLLAKPINIKVMVVTLSIFLLAIIFIPIVWRENEKKGKFIDRRPESCMYWSEDHYEQVSCNQKMGDTLVVALDSARLMNFKRITQPDTITKNGLGYVWYIRIDGSLEYYTGSGNHPVHPELRLRPITAYIIDKHIKPNGHAE